MEPANNNHKTFFETMQSHLQHIQTQTEGWMKKEENKPKIETAKKIAMLVGGGYLALSSPFCALVGAISGFIFSDYKSKVDEEMAKIWEWINSQWQTVAVICLTSYIIVPWICFQIAGGIAVGTYASFKAQEFMNEAGGPQQNPQ